MILRRATLTDAPAVAAIYLESSARHLAFVKLAHTPDEIRSWVRDELIANHEVWVVEDGPIVAFMGLADYGEGGWITHLYTDAHQTGRGYGAALMAKAKAVLPRPLSLFTFQENHGARRFYERAGFVAVKFSDGRENEERCPDVLYQLRSS